MREARTLRHRYRNHSDKPLLHRRRRLFSLGLCIPHGSLWLTHQFSERRSRPLQRRVSAKSIPLRRMHHGEVARSVARDPLNRKPCDTGYAKRTPCVDATATIAANLCWTGGEGLFSLDFCIPQCSPRLTPKLSGGVAVRLNTGLALKIFRCAQCTTDTMLAAWPAPRLTASHATPDAQSEHLAPPLQQP